MSGSPSCRIATKLRCLKNKLKEWNWSTFGDLKIKIEQLKAQHAHLETLLQDMWSEQNDETLHRVSEELRQNLAWEAELLQQKTRASWLQEGDRNTKFFHALIKARRSKNNIALHRPDGENITDPSQICNLAASHFDHLFTATPYAMTEELFDSYPATVSALQNDLICTLPSKQEIWEAVCSLSADSAPGVDGFTGHFFHGCWKIIQSDVVDMVRGFFLGDYLHAGVSTTLITLLPKIDNPKALTDFRPISLCTFASKLISKILASRFAQILPQLINEQQYGFVKGRSIHESIALAQEMVSDLDRRSEGGNIVFKYDMSKAYDRLEWRFLLRTMRSMGFSHIAQDLVYRSISNIRYRVSVNGFHSNEFGSSRGVRQGDPLSPLLFIMAQQILSYNLNNKQQRGELMPYRLGRSVVPISHLFYADDMLLFANGHSRSLQRLKRLMNNYEVSSGQQINLDKSAFYASKRIPRHRLSRIQHVTGCHVKHLPFKYLGASIYKGRCRIQMFEEVIGKFSRRIEGWYARFLSFGAKVTLLKSVLTSLPVHVFSCMAIPKQVQKRLDSLMGAFLWNQ